MSRRKSEEEYSKTGSARFFLWLSGEHDAYNDVMPEKENAEEESMERRSIAEILSDTNRAIESAYDIKSNKKFRKFKIQYRLIATVFLILLAYVMLFTTANLPLLGTEDRPTNNEVMQVYIENGIEDTGAVNFVTGMILNYRAFDTFGETCVLFVATTAVMVLLMRKEEEIRENRSLNDRLYEPKNDPILKVIATILVPVLFLFGIYVIFNGHLSPGGGFSGGAILGSGMILYVSAFGFDKMQKFFNEHTYVVVKVTALVTYCIVISYYLIMGANDLDNHISLGTPGMIFSAGIILWLNIFVGVEVACTMYAFYALFRRGGL